MKRFYSSSSACDESACSATPPSTSLGTVLSLTPFIATFALVYVTVSRTILPRLSRLDSARDGEDHFLPASAPASLQQVHAAHGSKSPRRRLTAATFAATLGLATVLGELILSEIADLVSAEARDTALSVVVPTLLVMLVLVIPFLEIQSVLSGSGLCTFQTSSRGRFPRWAWTLQTLGFGLWLVVFWSIGKALPDAAVTGDNESFFGASSIWGVGPSSGLWGSTWTVDTLARACLERIGIIGISLMALLSGFASVSSPWHMLTDGAARRKRPVTDADISRKQAGLEAARELLLTKRHRLASLQRKMAATTESTSPTGSVAARSPGGAIMGKIVGSLKGISGVGGNSADANEAKALQMEISGLETMETTLSTALSALKSRQVAEARAGTFRGRLLAIPAYIFSIYCVYRILATSLTSFRRLYYPASATFSSSDPINRFLGLLAKHWDPKLDQLAWARQISFLLSGVILIASANAVVQTFALFARWAPGLLHQAQANLALLIGQVSATYVISSGLLLRSNLPRDMGSAVGHALESALEPGFVDRWFEGWFLMASGATAVGIWVGRRIHGPFGNGSGSGFGEWGEEWDEFGGEEMGEKRA
ncbi:Abscisic acid G-protein coupled receptor-domain-containing protein [Coniella lustricola]|uniref:Abscisic acid G-protein coupled receptor-domain-containing protein n=1 Tax=Coniella lustricola TaxID=2025994 RepID=A0A2T2ZWG0_9PEZI|nr:Abscisic acid G-protein coupled receptor-domain-containing protein [Coniella lustricola]